MSEDWVCGYFEEGYARRWSLGPPTDATRKEAEALLAILAPPAGAPVLDLGCGHGKYAIALRSAGARVVGCDLAAALLRRGRDLASEAGATVHWVRGDMRHLPFPPACFGGAILLDALGFSESDATHAKLLEQLRATLLPGARLLLKLANGAPIVRDFRVRDQEVRDGMEVTITRTLAHTPCRLLEQIQIREAGRLRRFERRQRLFAPAEIRSLLESTGYRVGRMMGALSGEPLDPDVSPTMWIQAERGG